MTPRWTMMHKLLAAAVVAAGLAGVTAAPAFADDDGWHGRGHAAHEWREHEWREHEWREHHPWGYGYYAPRYSYYSGSGYYYAPPPPPPVYVPAPAPSLTFVVPIH